MENLSGVDSKNMMRDQTEKDILLQVDMDAGESSDLQFTWIEEILVVYDTTAHNAHVR